MTQEQFKAQLKQTVNEYIRTALAGEEVGDISAASRTVVGIKLTSLIDAVETAIRQATGEASDGSNYYWEDGRFFQDHQHSSVPNSAVAITDDLWVDWSNQKDHLVEEEDVTESMQDQILVRKSRFSASDGRRLMCVEHIVTTATPHRTKLFYFVPA